MTTKLPLFSVLAILLGTAPNGYSSEYGTIKPYERLTQPRILTTSETRGAYDSYWEYLDGQHMRSLSLDAKASAAAFSSDGTQTCLQATNQILKANGAGEVYRPSTEVTSSSYSSKKKDLPEVEVSIQKEFSNGEKPIKRITSSVGNNDLYTVTVSSDPKYYDSTSYSFSSGFKTDTYVFERSGGKCRLVIVNSSVQEKGTKFADVTKLDLSTCLSVVAEKEAQRIKRETQIDHFVVLGKPTRSVSFRDMDLQAICMKHLTLFDGDLIYRPGSIESNDNRNSSSSTISDGGI